jgi:radical SAM superfamily enzyme YgiQ (UPF0313 family)
MMGGPHVSFDYEDVLTKYPEIDLIVIGEGEQTLLELLPVIHDRHAWNTIPGIAYMDSGRLTVTEPRGFLEDLDSQPLPARHLLCLSRYQALGFPVSIITSRGCPNRCIFCQGRRMVGHKMRYRDLGLVADEIEQLLSYGLNPINIADDLFTANKQRVKAFCNEVDKRGIRFVWSAFSRVNTVDAETLKVMKEAGCYAVSFGIESGNPEMLKRIRKGITLDQARRAAALCTEAGIRAHASFMVGLPGESHQSLEDTRTFAEGLGIEYGYHFLAPFPGTTVREEIDDYDLEILTDDWSRYDANSAIVRTSHLLPEEIDAFVSAGYEKHEKHQKERMSRYQQGRCTAEERRDIEGYLASIVVFTILSEDLIENSASLASPGPDPFEELAGTIAQRVSMDPVFVRDTLKRLSKAGYLRCERTREGIRLGWAPNKPITVGTGEKLASTIHSGNRRARSTELAHSE